jgi:hypothetical protein
MWIANRTAARVGVATVAAGVLAAGAFTLISSAGASPSSGAGIVTMHAAAGRVSYGFRTLDDTADPATGWYLNLHQGNSNNIVANGQPTVNFRPLLCANI